MSSSLVFNKIFRFVIVAFCLGFGSCSFTSVNSNYCGYESELASSEKGEGRMIDSSFLGDSEDGNSETQVLEHIYAETRYLMGTFLSMELKSSKLDKMVLHRMSENLFDVVAKIEDEISHYRKDSDIGVVNSAEENQAFGLNPFACLFVRESLYLAEFTGGLIDVTVSSGQGSVGYQKLRLDGCILVKLNEGTTIDPSGLGKGFALDLLESEFRKSVGAECVYLFVNFGTSSIGYLASDSCPSRRREIRAREVRAEEGIIKELVTEHAGEGDLAPGASRLNELLASSIILRTNQYLTTSYSGNIVNPLTGMRVSASNSKNEKVISSWRRDNLTKRQSSQGYYESAITRNAMAGEARVKLKILMR